MTRDQSHESGQNVRVALRVKRLCQEYRKVHALSQRAFSKHAKLGPSFLFRLSENRGLNLRTFLAVARALDLTPAELMERVQDPKIPTERKALRTELASQIMEVCREYIGAAQREL